jgi:hypothetical protein
MRNIPKMKSMPDLLFMAPDLVAWFSRNRKIPKLMREGKIPMMRRGKETLGAMEIGERMRELLVREMMIGAG